jgi:hypothetical protein
LKEALELDPANTFVLDNLGLAHVQVGMLEEGIAEIKRGIDTANSPPSYGDLPYAYQMRAESPCL